MCQVFRKLPANYEKLVQYADIYLLRRLVNDLTVKLVNYKFTVGFEELLQAS